MTRPLVVFDLDGTLFDTAPDLLDSLNHAIATLGLAPAGRDDIGALAGRGARAMIARALDMRGAAVDETQMECLSALFLDHYGASIPGRSHLYPGALAALDRLAANGFAIAMCTNKRHGFAVRLLAARGILDRFATVTGGDSFEFSKPDPRHLLKTVEMAGGDRAATVMVGDSASDMDAARAAGIASVCVSFGYCEGAVDALGPDRAIGHYDALTPALVNRLIDRD